MYRHPYHFFSIVSSLSLKNWYNFHHFGRYDRENFPDMCSHFDCDKVFISRCHFSERKSQRMIVKEAHGLGSHSLG